MTDMMRYHRARDRSFIKTLAWLVPVLFLIGFVGGHFLFQSLGIF